MNKIAFLLLALLLPLQSSAQKEPPYLKYTNHPWVDSVFQQLTPEERITQLIFIPSYKLQSMGEVEKLINKHKIGGVVFFKSPAKDIVKMVNRYNKVSKTPLTFALDAEWGVGMRVTDGIKFPYAMSLGAIQDNKLIYQMGKNIGAHLKRMGMHINFAPVADVNNNPDNPVISYRSFGENPENVFQKSYAYAQGLNDVNILAVAKHFPGHGDTNVDSHHDLPTISHDKAHLSEIELYPFKKLIDNGLGGIMTAHLNIPALMKEDDKASSLSQSVVTDLLRNELKFKGLTFTDGIEMRGITKHVSVGKAQAMALIAGNDIVEFSLKVDDAVKEIKKAIKNGKLSKEAIDEKCKKVLAFKYWSGASDIQSVKMEKISQDLNSAEDLLLKRKLTEASVTVLNNRQNTLPVRLFQQQKIAVISAGNTETTPFQKMAGNYTKLDFFNVSSACTPKETDKLKKQLKDYDLVVVGVHNLYLSPHRKSITVNLNNGNKQKIKTKSFGISENMVNLIKYISNTHNSIVSIFGNAYTLKVFEDIENAKGLLITYQENEDTQEVAAQIIFGALKGTGRLPVSANSSFKAGDGVDVIPIKSLGYSKPLRADLKNELTTAVDSLVQEGLDVKAFPGCQVLIARKGQVVHHKSYGYHTYFQQQQVENNHLYDLASVTKITAPLLGLMYLTDQKKLTLESKLGDYWKDFRKSDKSSISFKEALAHQAGFQAYISFWKKMQNDDGSLDDKYFKVSPSKQYSITIHPNLYLHKKRSQKFIYRNIKESKLKNTGKYRYSGIPFLIFPKIIEQQSSINYEKLLTENFYKPLGAHRLCFKPYRFFQKNNIAPTENDIYFRNTLVDGYVHDETASLFGGVSGNAGLFGNANDLAKLIQMYMNMGYYGGKQYIDKETMKSFTAVQFPEQDNRRGAGFDKPLLDNTEKSKTDAYPCFSASPQSFGHSGFTGTLVWADPAEEIVFIFLCNRVYPTRQNKKLYDMNIRSRILECIYEHIML